MSYINLINICRLKANYFYNKLIENDDFDDYQYNRDFYIEYNQNHQVNSNNSKFNHLIFKFSDSYEKKYLLKILLSKLLFNKHFDKVINLLDYYKEDRYLNIEYILSGLLYKKYSKLNEFTSKLRSYYQNNIDVYKRNYEYSIISNDSLFYCDFENNYNTYYNTKNLIEKYYAISDQKKIYYKSLDYDKKIDKSFNRYFKFIKNFDFGNNKYFENMFLLLLSIYCHKLISNEKIKNNNIIKEMMESLLKKYKITEISFNNDDINITDINHNNYVIEYKNFNTFSIFNRLLLMLKDDKSIDIKLNIANNYNYYYHSFYQNTVINFYDYNYKSIDYNLIECLLEKNIIEKENKLIFNDFIKNWFIYGNFELDEKNEDIMVHFIKKNEEYNESNFKNVLTEIINKKNNTNNKNNDLIQKIYNFYNKKINELSLEVLINDYSYAFNYSINNIIKIYKSYHNIQSLYEMVDLNGFKNLTKENFENLLNEHSEDFMLTNKDIVKIISDEYIEPENKLLKNIVKDNVTKIKIKKL